MRVDVAPAQKDEVPEIVPAEGNAVTETMIIALVVPQVLESEYEI